MPIKYRTGPTKLDNSLVKTMSLMPEIEYVIGKSGLIIWKNAGSVSFGNVPAAEVSWSTNKIMAI